MDYFILSSLWFIPCKTTPSHHHGWIPSIPVGRLHAGPGLESDIKVGIPRGASMEMFLFLFNTREIQKREKHQISEEECSNVDNNTMRDTAYLKYCQNSLTKSGAIKQELEKWQQPTATREPSRADRTKIHRGPGWQLDYPPESPIGVSSASTWKCHFLLGIPHVQSHFDSKNLCENYREKKGMCTCLFFCVMSWATLQASTFFFGVTFSVVKFTSSFWGHDAPSPHFKKSQQTYSFFMVRWIYFIFIFWQRSLVAQL